MTSVIPRLKHAAPIAALSFLAVLAVSCGAKQETQQAEDTTSPETTSPAAMSDANIAAVVVAANTADIKNGEMAASRSKNPAVKAFASQMVADHNAVNKKASDLVAKLKVTPEDNETSRALVQNADATREDLGSRQGVDFDKAYVANEVAYHQAVLDMIDRALIPNATNAELKSLLESVKPAFQAHLSHAQQLQASLGT